MGNQVTFNLDSIIFFGITTPKNVLKNLKDKWLMGSQNFFPNQNIVTNQIES